MPPLEITTQLTLADWRAYQVAWTTRLQKHSRTSRRGRLVIVLIAVALATALALFAARLGQTVPLAAVVVGACATVIGVMTSARRIRGAATPDEAGVILGPATLRFDVQGIHLEKSRSVSHHDWSGVQEITATTEHLFVWIDRIAAVIVPLRDLPPDLTPQAALEQIRSLAAAAGPDASATSTELPAAPARIPETNTTSADTTRGLPGRIFRALTLRAREGDDITLSDRALVMWSLASLALLLLLDWITAGADAEFYSYGLVIVGWYASLTLLTALLWSRLSEPRVALRRTLSIALIFTPLAIVLVRLAVAYLPESILLGALILIALYATFYAHAALRSATMRVQPTAVFAGLLVMTLAAWFGLAQYVIPQFWYTDDDTAEDVSADAQSPPVGSQLEPLLFHQAEFVDDVVAAVDRPDDLPVAGFFLGFAGFGEERVFAEEIALAEQVIGAKYDTTARSVRLVNDQRDLAGNPFASPTALRRALSGLAEKMNLEEDVLFLALSSHGSENGEIAVSNGNLPFNNLSVDDLADALDEARIEWRVIIVSACYSGTFIGPLRNDHTIIITASAADRTSFGCSDDRDLTYFGEAFYRDALPATPNLKAAFQRARSIIAQREKDEGVEPSNPQAYFGNAIDLHLRALQVTQ